MQYCVNAAAESRHVVAARIQRQNHCWDVNSLKWNCFSLLYLHIKMYWICILYLHS